MSPVSHADGVHDMVDTIARHAVNSGEDQAARNMELADRSLEDMRRFEFTDSMIREVARHVGSFSLVVATRIKTQCPGIFASGDDVSMMTRVANPASDTEV